MDTCIFLAALECYTAILIFDVLIIFQFTCLCKPTSLIWTLILKHPRWLNRALLENLDKSDLLVFHVVKHRLGRAGIATHI
jgi:hypothetical protein